MKRKYLVGLVLALLLGSLVRADGFDGKDHKLYHFVFNTGFYFAWDWASSGPESEFSSFSNYYSACEHPPSTTFAPCTVTYDTFIGGPVPGPLGWASSFGLLCASEPYFPNCNPEDDQNSINFSTAYFTEKNGVIHFIPGVYTPQPGIPQLTEGTLTITVVTPEPATGLLLLSTLPLGLLLLRRVQA